MELIEFQSLQMGPQGVASQKMRLRVNWQIASERISCWVRSPHGQMRRAKSGRHGRRLDFFASFILPLSEESPRVDCGCLSPSPPRFHTSPLHV